MSQGMTAKTMKKTAPEAQKTDRLIFPIAIQHKLPIYQAEVTQDQQIFPVDHGTDLQIYLNDKLQEVPTFRAVMSG